VKRVEGVTTKINEPREGLSNRTPSLQISWDGAKLGITGQEVSKLLLDTEPRIMLDRSSGSRTGNMASSVAVVPYMLAPGEEKIIADRLHAVLSKPPKVEAPPAPPPGSPANVAGQWEVNLEFVRDSVHHSILLEQDGAKLVGTHHGEFASGDLNGTVAGNTVRFQSSYPTVGTRVSFQFSGTVEGGKMSGTVALGEYGEAKWTAERHQYRAGGRRG
jgi:L-seryl-tRNA(Ser) seleniumtransferase